MHNDFNLHACSRKGHSSIFLEVVSSRKLPKLQGCISTFHCARLHKWNNSTELQRALNISILLLFTTFNGGYFYPNCTKNVIYDHCRSNPLSFYVPIIVLVTAFFTNARYFFIALNYRNAFLFLCNASRVFIVTFITNLYIHRNNLITHHTH